MSATAQARRHAAALAAAALLAGCSGAAPEPRPGPATVAGTAAASHAAAAAGAGPAPARGAFQSGMWRGTANPRDGGPFTHCAISAGYPNGVALYFVMTDNDRFGIALARDEWRFPEGSEHAIAFTIDRRRPYEGKAVAVRFDMIAGVLPDTDRIFAEVKAGRILVVDTLGHRYRFDLTGIAPALDALKDCVERNLAASGGRTAEAARSSGGGNPFAKPGAASAERRAENSGGGALPSNPFVRPGGAGAAKPSAEGGGTESRDAPGSEYQHTAPDAVAAARRFVERLLAAADVADYRILVGPEAPADQGDADVVWRMGDQIGTLRIVEARRYPSVVEASAAIVRDASLICNEGFTSAIAPRRLRDARPAAQMSVACARPLAWHANYTVVPVSGAGYYRVNLTSFGDARGIDALQERIGRALPRVVPEG